MSLVLIQQLVRRHQLDRPADGTRRAVDAGRKFVGDSESETEGRNCESVQSKQHIASRPSAESGVIREAVRKIYIESVAHHGPASWQSVHIVIGRFVNLRARK